MEIVEKLTINDLIENRIDLIQRSDIAKHNINKRRIIYFIFMLLGISLLFYSINKKYPVGIIFSFLYSIWGLLETIFAKKRYLNYNRKNMKKNIELTAKQYGFSMNEIESITKIEDDKIVMEERGTYTIYLKSDYLGYTENIRSYILEFTNGRFIYLKKNTFKEKEEYLKFIDEIKSSSRV